MSLFFHIFALPDAPNAWLLLSIWWPITDSAMPKPLPLPLCHDGEDY